MTAYYTSFLWGCAVWLIAAIWFWREAILHVKRRDSIPLRIHVNGTRGKSGVTRLIAAGLRAGGLRAVGKTTGSAAMILQHDGSETPLKRRGPANIRELIPCIAHACFVGADAIVAECMALRPELQWFAEHRLLASHIGVITNIRTDHEDVMGQGLHSIASALANTIPANGILVTGPVEYHLLTEIGCLPANTIVHLADASKLDTGYFSGFDYEIFAQNIALALTVCELAGVDPETAIAGMRRARPDAGHLTISTVPLPNGSVSVINALAANDPDSTLLLFSRYIEPGTGSNIVWINGRTDRKLRSEQLCRALAACHQGTYIISGDASFLRNRLRRSGIANCNIVDYRSDKHLTDFLTCLEQPICLFAAGNIHGLAASRFLPLAHCAEEDSC